MYYSEHHHSGLRRTLPESDQRWWDGGRESEKAWSTRYTTLQLLCFGMSHAHVSLCINSERPLRYLVHEKRDIHVLGVSSWRLSLVMRIQARISRLQEERCIFPFPIWHLSLVTECRLYVNFSCTELGFEWFARGLCSTRYSLAWSKLFKTFLCSGYKVCQSLNFKAFQVLNRRAVSATLRDELTLPRGASTRHCAELLNTASWDTKTTCNVMRSYVCVVFTGNVSVGCMRKPNIYVYQAACLLEKWAKYLRLCTSVHCHLHATFAVVS